MNLINFYFDSTKLTNFVMIPPNSLIKGDCLDILPYIDDNSVNLILCDLPYATTDCAWDSLIPFDKLWKEYNRILVKNGTVILTASQPFTTDVINSQRNLFKYELIWIKNHSTGFQHAKNRPLKIHEDVLVFSKGAANHVSLSKDMRMTYNPQGVNKISIPKKYNGKNTFVGILGSSPSHKKEMFTEFENYPENVIYFEMDSDSWHPTQKPVALFSYLINTYSNEGDLVVDNCGGSFTSAIACQNTNRSFVCIEQDEKYFIRGVERVRNNIPAFGNQNVIVIENLFEYLMNINS